ncbi:MULTISPECIES: hypothetical protein [unclassified Synechococcus]|uniref:hypothetical protein n=1 Tax=unclassified Synechococcus TaxID=2626047 RepID=UPI0021A33D9F|nr:MULTISPECIES: hypothetical protein [unclassified Synechococcus]MCT0212743.1 hypothetical protein [Synechococcus sp. CS-1326]MCT0233751.1 hypothetical protein [Synechococcus sp. CS-1327]
MFLLFKGLEAERGGRIPWLESVVEEAFPLEEASRLCIILKSGYLTREPQWLISAD